MAGFGIERRYPRWGPQIGGANGYFMKSLFRSTAAVVLAAITLSGCGVACEPASISMEVQLSLVSEEVRSLPILASGRTSVAGVEVPDSHGVLQWTASFTDGRVSVVDVQDLQLEISIMGASVPVEIVKVEGMDHGTLYDGDDVRIWWTVDPRFATPLERALNEGDTYQAKVRFRWSLDGCQYSGSGVAEAQNPGFVQPSVITTTFDASSAAVTKSGASASYEAHVTIKNGISTAIQKVTAIAVGLGEVPGTVLWTQSTVTVNGLPISTAAPGDDVAFRGGPLPTSGSDPWLLVLYVEHQSTSHPGTQRDTLAWLD